MSKSITQLQAWGACDSEEEERLYIYVAIGMIPLVL